MSVHELKKAKKSVVEKQGARKRDVTTFIVTAVLMVIYLLWRLLFTLPFDQGIPQMIFAILLLIAHMTQSAVKSHNGPADRLQSVGGACR